MHAFDTAALRLVRSAGPSGLARVALPLGDADVARLVAAGYLRTGQAPGAAVQPLDKSRGSAQAIPEGRGAFPPLATEAEADGIRVQARNEIRVRLAMRRKITTKQKQQKVEALREGRVLPVTIDDLVYGTAVGDVPGPDVRAVLELARAIDAGKPSISWAAQEEARGFFNANGLAATLDRARELDSSARPAYSTDMAAATIPCNALPSAYARTFPTVRQLPGAKRRVPVLGTQAAVFHVLAASLVSATLGGCAGAVALATPSTVEVITAAQGAALDTLRTKAALYGVTVDVAPAGPRLSVTLRAPAKGAA